MLVRFICFTLIALAISESAPAQSSTNVADTLTSPVPPEKIPPAPPLAPAGALKTFKLPDGFRLELVASEPMIESPVAATFDPDGRLWVLEMRGFMLDVKGEGETNAVGRLSILEDTDHDGRMDKSTVFLDHLVMARAFALVRNGVLVAEPPNLFFYRDTNGDGRPDEKILVANDYATQANPALGLKANTEHSANGLLWALDNWIYSANYTARFRNVDGAWHREPTVFRGQWGMTQDDFGRLFYNSNSDHLRGDLVPADYLNRNPNYSSASGANVQIAKDQTVWPTRVNPGVNRGYLRGTLRADGSLASFTAACAPLIYRGDQFPSEFHGNAFVCEPAGNLVRRDVLTESNIQITATNAYSAKEFLTSTDERFRPVNLHNGPDGALYVIDMYHGIIQHHAYVTPYLRQQILARDLDKGANYGRIYRVVHESAKTVDKPKLSSAPSSELVKHFAHPNGWWRDTAQRLLIERGDASAWPDLKQMAASDTNLFARLHALWTLDGMGKSDQQVLFAALTSQHPKIRATAIRLLEPLFRTPAQHEVLTRMLRLTGDDNSDVQLQLALTLGEIKDAAAESTMAALLQKHASNVYIRDAVVSGLAGRELEFLERLLTNSAWQAQSAGAARALGTLAKCVLNERKPDRVDRVLALAADQSSATTWRKLAMLDGMIDVPLGRGRNRSAVRPRPVELPAEPLALAALTNGATPELRGRIDSLTKLMTWPGQAGAEPRATVKPLTAEQEARFKAGKELYFVTCGACHQPHGNGQEGLAPALADSEWVLGSDERLVRIALQGVRGPITVKGKMFQLEMPQMNVLNDEQISGVLTYIRREWGHTASPIDPPTIAKIRADTEKHEDAWTEPELRKIP